jgi:hypothetical protein
MMRQRTAANAILPAACSLVIVVSLRRMRLTLDLRNRRCVTQIL